MPVVKSASPQNQRATLNVFDFQLTSDDMKQLDQLGRADGRVDNQDPKTYEEFV